MNSQKSACRYSKVCQKAYNIQWRGELMDNESELFQYLQDDNFILKSECGISYLKTKLQIIDAELSMSKGRKIIRSTTSRIKAYDSLIAKLKRKDLPEDVDIVKDRINDLVGVRAVCSYIDDLYQIADIIRNTIDFRVLRSKDYIEDPKKSGYRSYHLLLEVPVSFMSGVEWVKIELQLRTSAMDYWASLDSQLQYKKENKGAEIISRELKSYAKVIDKIDKKMLDLRKRIEEI